MYCIFLLLIINIVVVKLVEELQKFQLMKFLFENLSMIFYCAVSNWPSHRVNDLIIEHLSLQKYSDRFQKEGMFTFQISEIELCVKVNFNIYVNKILTFLLIGLKPKK